MGSMYVFGCNAYSIIFQHLFLLPQRDQLIVAMKTATLENIGFDLRYSQEMSVSILSNGFQDQEGTSQLAAFPKSSSRSFQR